MKKFHSEPNNATACVCQINFNEKYKSNLEGVVTMDFRDYIL